MFDVIEGFQSAGVKDVSKKHLKRFIVLIFFFLIGILFSRWYVDADKLFSITVEMLGGLFALTLIVIADYLREVTSLRKKQFR